MHEKEDAEQHCATFFIVLLERITSRNIQKARKIYIMPRNLWWDPPLFLLIEAIFFVIAAKI